VNKSLRQVFPSSGGEVVFFIKNKSTDSSRENDICRSLNGVVTCKSVAPFTSVAIIQVVDKSQLIINKGDTGLRLFNFDLNIQEEVLSPPMVGALLSFDN
jgi:hypothetical protein